MKTIFTPFFTAILSVFIFLSGSLYSQSTDEIKKSGLYYYGQGMGPNYLAARNDALRQLSESISVQIKSEFEQIVKEKNKDLDSYTQIVVTTYSSTVLNDYKEKLLSDEPGNFSVLLFITKEDMKVAFKERENIIHSYIRTGLKAEDEVRIADALRYYYWALVLTRSHPDNNKLRYDFGDGQSTPLMMGLSDKINSIFSKIMVEITNVEQRSNSSQQIYYLRFRYAGKPIQNIDYTYYDGMGYTGLFGTSNGTGIVMLSEAFAKDADQLRLRIEYQYTNKADIDPEVKRIMEGVEVPYFEKSDLRISIRKPKGGEIKKENTIISIVENHLPEYQKYAHTIENVLQQIGKGSESSIKDLFTPEGFGMYQKLIANGRVTILEKERDTLRIVKVGNEVMVRSVPMLFAFQNTRERFIEHVVFNFDAENKINNISFALSDIALRDILSKPDDFGSVEEKYFLIKFMEDFKTAYSLKRYDFLDAVFDENALIIVGNIVKKTDEPVEKVQGMYASLSNDQIEYIKLSKSQYMDRLKRLFNRNEFINIRFEENTVAKTQKANKIYGIQIAQHYYSSTYADKGYLFLMIDLTDSVNPKIYVRTWQPKKNPDGSIYGLHDFRF